MLHLPLCTGGQLLCQVFSLCTLPLRSYHHVVCSNMVRVPTGNFLIASSPNAHVKQCLLVGQVDEVKCKHPPQLLCFTGQKEDFFCLFLGQPCHCKGCIQLHSPRWTTTRDILIHTQSSMNISISRLPWSAGGRDPQLMSNDQRPVIESADV